jgi:predicted metalloprotease with PDZ domain
VKALHAVAPWDWEKFLSSRIDAINERAPLDGIRAGGWVLTYDDEPNVFFNAREKVDGASNLSLSLGVWVKTDGVVADVVNGSPAFLSGVTPAMRLLAIDGRKWSTNAARAAIVTAEQTTQPIELIVESADIVRVLHVDYHAGLRNPHLVRDPERPDLLGHVIAPRFASAP